MDVNGLPMWLVAGAADFGLLRTGDGSARAQAAEDLAFDRLNGHITLASQQDPPNLQEAEDFARQMVMAPSPVCDAADTFAWWTPGSRAEDGTMSPGRVEASGFAEGAEILEVSAASETGLLAPTDMALGSDHILYIARSGAIIMADLRGRYPNDRVERKEFSASLLAPDRDGGAWAFDRGRGQLARLKGYPLRLLGVGETPEDRFGPKPANPNPPKLRLLTTAKLDARYDAIAMAMSPAGQIAILAWETAADAVIFLLEDGRFVALGRLQGLQFPWSIAWHGPNQIAIMASDGPKVAQQAYLYATDAPGRGADHAIQPIGLFHPLRAAYPAGFCNSLGPKCRYLACPALVGSGTAQADLRGTPEQVRALIPVSGPRFARTGGVLLGPFDSGLEGSIWHRIYAEAAVSNFGHIALHLYGSESRAVPKLPGEAEAPDWAPHRIGGAAENTFSDQVPQAAWCDMSSEIAGASALLKCAAKIGQAGLFTLMLQHAHRKVRRIKGRYAWIYVELSGDSQSTPELAALRLYANRLSYRDAYLPDFYSESLGGPDAEAQGPATPQDFLERYLGMFEGVLTEVEGRIAHAWRLTDPAVAPKAALPWIGQWIGVDSDPACDAEQLRNQVLAAPYTAELHGSHGGLLAALEIASGGRCITGGQIDPGLAAKPGGLIMARFGGNVVRALLLGADSGGRAFILTGGGITRGDIVVVEAFRLRRTFATILGVNLADRDDPLTLGMAQSGNSFVGDTLILGEEQRNELMALFRADLDFARASQPAVREFFARLAHRAIILVRGVNDASEIERFREIARETAPAHVAVQIASVSTPLIIGAASLVGIDTYLMDAPEIQRVQLGVSILGRGDQVQGEGWLDGRADGPRLQPPIARGSAPSSVWRHAPFLLSGAESSAAKGRTINRYIWTWESQPPP
jgi:phage tail-like protein